MMCVTGLIQFGREVVQGVRSAFGKPWKYREEWVPQGRMLTYEVQEETREAFDLNVCLFVGYRNVETGEERGYVESEIDSGRTVVFKDSGQQVNGKIKLDVGVGEEKPVFPMQEVIRTYPVE